MVGENSPQLNVYSLPPFIELLAPPEIEAQVERNIRSDLPKGTSLPTALGHARSLLLKVKKIPVATHEAILKARQLISKHSPEDVPFLALAIEKKAGAIVSRDKTAFETQSTVKRWELRDAAQLIVTYESGTLSLVVVGKSFEVIVSTLGKIMVLILQTIVEMMHVFAQVAASVLAGSAEILSKVPNWAWIIVGVIGVATLITVLADKNLRNNAAKFLSKLGESLTEVAGEIIGVLKVIWEALRKLFEFLWEVFTPLAEVLLVIVGVLFKRIHELYRQLEKLDDPSVK